MKADKISVPLPYSTYFYSHFKVVKSLVSPVPNFPYAPCNGPLTKTTFYVQFLKANFLEIKPLKGEFMDTYPLSYFSNGGIWRCFALIAYLGDHLNEGISDF